jgi:hypothetical protein
LACGRFWHSNYPADIRQSAKAHAYCLVFEETETERTQEFILRWSTDEGRSFREIVRQQWNLSPPATTREIEDHQENSRVPPFLNCNGETPCFTDLNSFHHESSRLV